MSTQRKRVLGYVRASTDDQKLTLEAQDEDIRAIADEWRAELVCIEQDPGVSGTRAIEKCDGLMRLLDQLQPGDVVVVAKRDRLSRKIVKMLALEEMIEERGASLYSLDGVGNGDDDSDWAMRVMTALFSEWEVRQIRKRTKRAAQRKQSRGERWGQIPYGIVQDAESGLLVPCEDQQRVISQMQAHRRAGASLRCIADMLNRAGIPAANGGKWRHTSVGSVLRANSEDTADVQS